MPASATDGREQAVRESFAHQADFCVKLGSPFTGHLCALVGERLDRATPIGRRILDWPGDPDPRKDALPLRLCGGLHALARSGSAPGWTALYPPAPLPDDETLWRGLSGVLEGQGSFLDPWLDGPPQTNEVGRSNVLMPGLLAIADHFGLPIHLFELGASAGLNLLLDRYGFDLGGIGAGDPQSRLRLRPEWEGPPPPRSEVRVDRRRGVDVKPGNVIADRERLLAYVWADQPKRLLQLEAAIDIATADPPPLDRGDAADWLETHLQIDPVPGVTRVVQHSIAFQYFPPDTQARVTARIEAAGARARVDAPVAWLRYEWVAGDATHSLRLRTWPGEERLLAYAHAHGAWVRWLG